MKIETKTVVTFTDEEYNHLNQACLMLDEIVNGNLPTPVIKDACGEALDLDELFGHFADFVNWVEENRE